MAKQCEVVISIPRQIAHQTQRANISANDAQEYFRRSIYIPFIDSILQKLKERFSRQSSAIHYASALIAHLKLYTFDKVRLALDIYKDYIEGEKQLYAEYERWLQKWQKVGSEKLPTNAIDALTSCSNDFFPNIRTLLIIAVTIPVTTATPERTFSTLKLLKSYLRTTMGQDRLTGLALL